MKLKSILLLLVSPLLMEVLIACCTCNGPDTYYFKYGKFSIFNIDNRGRDPLESSESELAKTAYGIRLKFSTIKTFALLQINPHFLPAALAMGCVCPPPYSSNERIKSLKIISVNDFDESHRAGADVSEYFKIFQYGSYASIATVVIDDLMYFGNFDADKNISWDLLLMTAPTNTETQFQIEIEFINGRTLKETTSVVKLK